MSLEIDTAEDELERSQPLLAPFHAVAVYQPPGNSELYLMSTLHRKECCGDLPIMVWGTTYTPGTVLCSICKNNQKHSSSGPRWGVLGWTRRIGMLKPFQDYPPVKKPVCRRGQIEIFIQEVLCNISDRKYERRCIEGWQRRVSECEDGCFWDLADSFSKSFPQSIKE